MWQTFQRLLKSLVPFQKLFLLTGLVSVGLAGYLLLNSEPEHERYLPPLVMLTAWCLSLASVTWGIQYTGIQAPESGFFAKLRFKLSKAMLWVAEVMFLLTSLVLLWLSIRALSFYLNN